MLHTHRPARFVLAAACAVQVIVSVRPAGAQTQPPETVYVTASALADVKRFSGDPATNVLDGNGFGGSVAVGTHLAPRWDLEAVFDASGYTETTHSHSLTVRRETITLQSITRNRAMSFAAVVRYHTAPRGRLQIGYLGGLQFLRLQRRFETEGPADTPAALIPKPLDLVDYSAAPVVGVDLRVGITERLSIVPALHVSAFQFPDVSGLLVRPRIGLRWTF